jgi:enoyl-CoA hydratase
VAGYAFGGGFELALMCDLMVVSPSACFALPEVTIGLIPGAGGTQRLTRVVGKARAMDVVLNARRISGAEAAAWGIASSITAEGESVVEAAVKVAESVANKGAIAVMVGKEAVNAGT